MWQFPNWFDRAVLLKTTDITEHLFLPTSDDVAKIAQVYSDGTDGYLELEEKLKGAQ